MKILVSGASGFLGREVVTALISRGHQVRAITRHSAASFSSAPNSVVEVFYADLRVSSNLEAAFDGMDALIHLAAATQGSEDTQFASTVIGTERLMAAMARSATKRLIHVSSFVVYDWGKVGRLLDETTPLIERFYDMGGYTIAKVWQERIVNKFATENNWDLTVLRPGFIWGRDHADIAGMGRRVGATHLLFAPFARLPLTHVNNCADCLVQVTENKNSSGKIFNIVDDHDIRIWKYALEYSRRWSAHQLLVPIPYYVGLGVAQLAATTSYALFGNKGKLPSLLSPRRYRSQFKPVRFSNKKLREELHWTPPYSFAACLDLTYSQSKPGPPLLRKAL